MQLSALRLSSLLILLLAGVLSLRGELDFTKLDVGTFVRLAGPAGLTYEYMALSDEAGKLLEQLKNGTGNNEVLARSLEDQRSAVRWIAFYYKEENVDAKEMASLMIAYRPSDTPVPVFLHRYLVHKVRLRMALEKGQPGTSEDVVWSPLEDDPKVGTLRCFIDTDQFDWFPLIDDKLKGMLRQEAGRLATHLRLTAGKTPEQIKEDSHRADLVTSFGSHNTDNWREPYQYLKSYDSPQNKLSVFVHEYLVARVRQKLSTEREHS
jgi:hypothetical protein